MNHNHIAVLIDDYELLRNLIFSGTRFRHCLFLIDICKVASFSLSLIEFSNSIWFALLFLRVFRKIIQVIHNGAKRYTHQCQICIHQFLLTEKASSSCSTHQKIFLVMQVEDSQLVNYFAAKMTSINISSSNRKSSSNLRVSTYFHGEALVQSS